MIGHAAPAGSKDTGVVYRKGPNGTKVPVQDENGKIKTWIKDKGGAPMKNWKTAVSDAGAEVMDGRDLLDGPMYVEVTIIRARGPGHFGKRGLLPSAPAYPAVMPDVLKLCRSTEDALNNVVWRDDSRNVCMHIEKVFAEPGEPEGAEIRIWRLVTSVGLVRIAADQLALTA